MIKVYHSTNVLSMAVSDAAKWPEQYRLVAEVDADELGVAFERTNTIDRAWWENEGVRTLVGPARSTSVGDVAVLADGTAWRCEMCGWSQIG